MKNLSPRALFKAYRKALTEIYTHEEAGELTLWLFEKYLNLNKRDLLLDVNLDGLPPELPLALKDIQAGKPIQYVFGEAPFYGRSFKVNPNVLIPRNETEELVHLVLNMQQGKPKLMDIGTGSGCIAITLCLELPGSEIYALDISPEALEVAKENALKLGADISFLEVDVLTGKLSVYELDGIISNPPYVRKSEMQEMHVNVLDHEPQLALFVADDDPLIFYRAIAKLGLDHLKIGGRLYFEINEALAKEVKALLADLGYENIQIEKDLNGKDRIVWAENPGG